MYKKPSDPEYSGVRVEKIKSAKPTLDPEVVKRYAYYQKERTAIYVKKEIEKLPPPWTEDPMFKNFKFTMTKRYLDRQSRNLIQGILERDDVSYENKLLNCFLFRLINKWDIFEHFPNKYINFDTITDEYIDTIRANITSTGRTSWGTDAYMISGTVRAIKMSLNIDKGGPQSESVFLLIQYINQHKQEIIEASKNEDPSEIINSVKRIHGIGAFLAAQIVMDWTYIKEFPFSDNSCCDIGPGTKRGLNHLFTDFDGMTLTEAVYWWRENIKLVMDEHGHEWDPESWFWFLNEDQRGWNLQDITNSFCELSKAMKIWTPEEQRVNGRSVRAFTSQPKTKCLFD